MTLGEVRSICLLVALRWQVPPWLTSLTRADRCRICFAWLSPLQCGTGPRPPAQAAGGLGVSACPTQRLPLALAQDRLSGISGRAWGLPPSLPSWSLLHQEGPPPQHSWGSVCTRVCAVPEVEILGSGGGGVRLPARTQAGVEGRAPSTARAVMIQSRRVASQRT